MGLAEEIGLDLKYCHISNSGSVLDMHQSYFNLVRVGMILYGAYPSDETSESIDLEPAMNFTGPVVQLKRVQAGTPVSYGSVYAPDSDAYIAVVQTGFADGMPRNWFREGYVGYKGSNYRIAGRVCMDQFMVNFGDDKPAMGDHVLIFGDDGKNQIPLEEIAQKTDLTTYVLMTAIAILCVVGSYAVRNSVFDVVVMIAFGAIGWLMQRVQIPAAPVVFGLILGPLLEENIRRSLIVNGEWSVFLTRPISATLLAIAALALFYPALRDYLARRRAP